MLEENDLLKIRTLVREEVKGEINGAIAPLKKDIESVKADVANSRNLIKGDIDNAVNPLKKDIRKVKKDINMIIEVFDRQHINLEKRVEKVEIKVGIAKPLF